MESVVFDGKEFAKASVLAEKFGYTQDYLGQLCRGKKVDARLVGRAWYINLDSLLSHRTARYKSPAKEVEVESKKTPNHYLSRIDVEPILKQKTVKILRNDAGKLTEFPVKYVGDDYSLIPHVNKSAISSYLHIEPAEAEKIAVHKEKNTLSITNFKAEPLPEFSLSGRLDVEGIPEVTEESLVLPNEPAHKVEIAVSEPALVPERPARSLKLRTIARPAPKAPVESVARPPAIPKKLVTTATPLKSKANPRKSNSAPSFAPASVRRVQKDATQEESSFAWPLVGLLVGLVSGFFIIATEVSVKANQNSYTDNFIIKIENLTQTAEVILAKIY